MAKDEKKKKKPKFVKRKRGAMSKGEARTKRIRDDFDAEMAASSSEESEGGGWSAWIWHRHQKKSA